MPSIAILQPYIPHYREDFFMGLSRECDFDLYCYEKLKDHQKDRFLFSRFPVHQIRSFVMGPWLGYDFTPLMNRQYKTLVLMLNFSHISTWILLITAFLHKKKIILWGHGISVKRFLKEEKCPDFLLACMIRFSDGVWFYTERELALWRIKFPHKLMVSLNNSISEIDKIITSARTDDPLLRRRYGITQPIIFIFCARFTAMRRIDLLINAICLLPKENYGFIIIGDGDYKPDFSLYPNVYDFGMVYDRNLKDGLFRIADAYFQPAWVGLSIVEAMAYSLPVITFKRTDKILQCVEYSYIQDGINGLLLNKESPSYIDSLIILQKEDFKRMGNAARQFVLHNLSMSHMVSSALQTLMILRNN